jgi:hypothetical protein
MVAGSGSFVNTENQLVEDNGCDDQRASDLLDLFRLYLNVDMP